jgi:hypothetical protein
MTIVPIALGKAPKSLNSAPGTKREKEKKLGVTIPFKGTGPQMT